MKKFKPIFLISLCVIVIFFSVSCNSNGSVQSSEISSDEASQSVENTDPAPTEKPTVAAPIGKPTDHLVKIEDTTGLDLNIKVLSQNVRCVDDDGGTVEQRKSRLGALIEEYSPDLIGTQEATSKWMDYLKYMGGYRAVGYSRDGKNARSGEWCAILYKIDRFILVDSGTFWLSETPDAVGSVEGSLCRRICTWAELFDRYTGETIIMANTHLDHSNNDVREKQAYYLTQHLFEQIGENIDATVYLTGDFNCGKDSRPYNAIRMGGFVDARTIANEDVAPIRGTYHGYTSGANEIDYCFVLNPGEVLTYDIITKHYVSEGETEPGFVSDHYGVLVTFCPASLM